MPQAIAFAAYGGPEVLHLTRVRLLAPGPGQVWVAVHLSGVNPLDWKIRSGSVAALHPVDLPYVPGLELSGTVIAVGAGVGLSKGAEVLGRAPATYATHAVAKASQLVSKPAGLGWEEAAALPVAAEAAYRALAELEVAAGDTLLIHGAGGAVGNLAVQFAVARGAHVIGTAREASYARLAALGVLPVTLSDATGSLRERVTEVAPGGVDAALDLVGGGEVLATSVRLTHDSGRVVTLADPRGAQVRGVRFSAVGGEDYSVPALRQALELHAAGSLSLPLHRSYPLAEAAAAHREGERGHLTGKIVLSCA